VSEDFLQGVDVSRYQGASIDWRAAAAAGITFAYVKATEGADWVDMWIGRTPIIYISPAFARAHLLGQRALRLQSYGLWIAQWGVEEPEVPGPWSRWDQWQRGQIHLHGFSAPVDINLARAAWMRDAAPSQPDE